MVENREPFHLWPTQIGDDAMRILDQAGEIRRIDDSLLDVANRQALRREISKTVMLVQALDLDRLLARQSWWSRFTGAAVEEKLTFEVAARRASAAFAVLEKLVADGVVRAGLMQAERRKLDEAAPKLDQAIDYGQALLSAGSPVDQVVRARFERKVANLVTIRSANEMALQQLSLTEANLVALTDRFIEISSVLFPLWQQQLFAVLHAPAALGRSDDCIVSFRACNSALAEYFSAEAQP